MFRLSEHSSDMKNTKTTSLGKALHLLRLLGAHGKWIGVRELARNPLIIGTLVGLAGNLLGLSIPGWLEPTVTRIGSAALALGLMAAGASLRFERLASAKALAGLVLGIRHVVLPLIAWFLARLLQLAPTQATVLLAFSALPSSSRCYVLAARMGYDGALVAGLVTLSTLLGVVSLPFALGVLG